MKLRKICAWVLAVQMVLSSAVLANAEQSYDVSEHLETEVLETVASSDLNTGGGYLTGRNRYFEGITGR